jgi:hypothetical protein
MSLFSFLRKYGETEDPLFRSMPVETAPPPDKGDIGATPFQDLLANMEDPLANEGEEFNG